MKKGPVVNGLRGGACGTLVPNLRYGWCLGGHIIAPKSGSGKGGARKIAECGAEIGDGHV
mgnify:FL=1